MKRCTTCKKKRSLTKFNKHSGHKDGFSSQCKSCVKKTQDKNKEKYDITRKSWRARNKTKVDLYQKEYNQKTRKTQSLQQKIRRNKHKRKYRKAANLYQAKRRKIDPIYRISGNMRSRLNHFIKKDQNDPKFSKYIGCDKKDLISYLESNFEPWMNWNNYGKYNSKRKTWNIDHVIPLASAKNKIQLFQLCHYKNLKPILAIKNIQKSNKLS